MIRYTLITVVVVISFNLSIAQCTKDTDCKGERICVNGECVEPRAEEAPATEPDVKEAPKVETKQVPKSSMGAFMFYLDPVGALFFGPHVGFEIGVGPNSFIDIHYRHSAFGLIYDVVATEGFDWWMKMGSGAAGGGYKHYIPFLKFLTDYFLAVLSTSGGAE